MSTFNGTPLASAGTRLGALLLDGVLAVVTLGIGYIIWLMITWTHGQTPGKKMLGLRVIDMETGKGATWGKMFVREFVGKSLLGSITFGITYLVSIFMIVGASHQGVWDKLAKTVVVSDKDGALA